MKIYFPLFFLLVGFTSCGIYRQNVVNVPMFQEKRQLQLAAHESFNGPEGQAAYSFTNNFALIANYNLPTERKTTYSDINYEINKHYFGEVGLGLFKKRTAASNGNIKEIFVLAGKGMTSHFVQFRDSAYNISSEYRQAYYNRFCVQADLGQTLDKLSFAISPRLFYIHYYNITDTERDDYKDLSGSYVYLEGALTLRYKIIKYLSLSGQACVTIPVNDFMEREYNYYYDFSPFNLNFGLVLNLNLLTSKN